MRNAALGDCLVRLYEHTGHHVTAATYYGDEGAHVAKCLWWLTQYMKLHPGFILDRDIPVEQRGEWLGSMYTQAVQKLDLASYTTMPYVGVISAKVINITKHSASDAPATWNVVTLQISESTVDTVQVVCGGTSYHVNDIVAYLPVGQTLNKQLITSKDMKGTQSNGVMLSRHELGITADHTNNTDDTNILVKSVQDTTLNNNNKTTPDKSSKTNKQHVVDLNDVIYTLPSNTPIGVPLIELGRISNTDCPSDRTVYEFVTERQLQSKHVLRQLETGDTEMCKLWKHTGEWSLNEFRNIHSWLNCRFDIEFYESQVGHESIELVKSLYSQGKLVMSNGAIGADLTKYKLGFCLLLKSNGSGLYATKDLSLAQKKFDTYKIDQSIYVVDTAQSHHFKQVFKILETVMNYAQAKNCYHLSYGQVVLPSGRMKSRSGQVILFSQLKHELGQQIYNDYLIQHDANAPDKHNHNNGDDTTNQSSNGSEKTNVAVKENEIWSSDEIAHAQHAISIGTIKYGMLNHDTIKDIVFVLDEWVARSGNTGPYMMYAYARIQSIIRTVESKLTADQLNIQPDYTLLSHETEHQCILQLHLFWSTVQQCTQDKNPSGLCTYVYELAKLFTSFYEACSVANADTIQLKITRLQFIKAIGLTIKQSLYLLGIETLERM